MTDPAQGIDARKFEGLLLERRTALWADIRRELAKHENEKYAQLIRSEPADLEDRAVADLLVDTNLAEIERDVEELRAVQHALSRVHTGSYGLCARCGRRIDPQRLEALPHSPLCIECARDAERSAGVSAPKL